MAGCWRSRSSSCSASALRGTTSCAPIGSSTPRSTRSSEPWRSAFRRRRTGALSGTRSRGEGPQSLLAAVAHRAVDPGAVCVRLRRGFHRRRRILTALRGHGDAEGVGAQDLWGALLVEDVEVRDGKAGGCEQLDDRPGEVQPPNTRFSSGSRRCCQRRTPSSGARPCSRKCRVPPGLRNPPDLGKGGGHVRNRAQRPRGQRGIEAVVLERQRLAIQAGPLHRDARLSHTFLGQSPADVGRLDGGDPGNGRRVEGDVVARAKAELDDASFEPSQTRRRKGATPSARTRR